MISGNKENGPVTRNEQGMNTKVSFTRHNRITGIRSNAWRKNAMKWDDKTAHTGYNETELFIHIQCD